jgi:hypothetical protein
LVGGGSLGARTAPIWANSGVTQCVALPSASKLPWRYVAAMAIEMRLAGRYASRQSLCDDGPANGGAVVRCCASGSLLLPIRR